MPLIVSSGSHSGSNDVYLDEFSYDHGTGVATGKGSGGGGTPVP